MTEEQIRERLVQARVEQSPPVVQEWFGPERLREQMRDFLAGEIERLDRDDLAEAFAHHCPIPGAHPDDYKNQLLELPVLGHALVGIRFWSLRGSRARKTWRNQRKPERCSKSGSTAGGPASRRSMRRERKVWKGT